MSSEESKTLAQEYFERLINVHNVAVVDELFDSNIRFHDPAIPGGSISGLDAIKLFFNTFFAAFPDVQFTIEDLLAEDDKVSARFTWRGTHRSTILGIVATHKVVTVPGTNIFHMANNKIVEVRVCMDTLLFVKQLVELPQFG
ncbi:ester cyclase [Dictyobacter formicarum]|uniref:Ester cyclase n=1 Tax=Dictyobacter formicarum TaxID=2778368 RepID=A0ABQ3VMS0_9CHLR|nr:ester cyclase [Dictyobacter formicarum]GHO87524.1 hypothetical protein KSZ_55300 [Dictyobacter formicarum]